MALRLVCLAMLASVVATAHAQSLRLVVVSASRSGSEVRLTDPFAVDSTDLLDDIPSFHPTAGLLYYTKHSNDSTAVVQLDVTARKEVVLLRRSEPVANVRMTPDLKYVTFISGSGKNLVRWSVSKKDIQAVQDLTHVTSYCWIDDNAGLAVRDGDPPTLTLFSLRPFREMTVARNVAATLPASKKTFWFIHKLSVDIWSIKEVKENGSVSIAAEAMTQSEVFAVLPDRTIIMASGNELFSKSDDADWKKIQLPFATGEIKSIGSNASGDQLFVLFAAP